jgi:hypothetical protein
MQGTPQPQGKPADNSTVARQSKYLLFSLFSYFAYLSKSFAYTYTPAMLLARILKAFIMLT